MADANTNANPGGAAPAAAPASGAPAPAAGAAPGVFEQAVAGAGGQTQATGTVDPSKPKEGGAPGNAAPAAPKPLELKKPEGSDFDDATLGNFTKLATELGLDGEKAQKALDFVGKLQADGAKAALTAYKAQAEKWVSELKADKEFGGEKLGANLKLADAAMKKFAPELIPFLEGSPALRAHPGIVKAFIRIGLADKDDSITAGAGGKPNGKAKDEQAAFIRGLYDHPASQALLPKE